MRNIKENLKRFISFLVGTIVGLLMVGCTGSPDTDCISVRKTCPHIVILKEIKEKPSKPVRIPIKENKGDYILVPKKALKEASKACQKNRKLAEKEAEYIKFYVKQNLVLRKHCKIKRR